jgi:excisionase family DNA binding protein
VIGQPETAPVKLEPLLSIAQAAAILGVSYREMCRRLERGELVFVRDGHRRKIERAALRGYIAAARTRSGRSP